MSLFTFWRSCCNIHVSRSWVLPASSPRGYAFNFMLELHKTIDKATIYDIRNVWHFSDQRDVSRDMWARGRRRVTCAWKTEPHTSRGSCCLESERRAHRLRLLCVGLDGPLPACPPPQPRFSVGGLRLESGSGGSVFSVESGQKYRQGLFFFRERLLNVTAHHCARAITSLSQP